VVVGSALAVASAILLVLTFSYGRDQGIYAMVARAILDGQLPYRDAFDFKPPGIFVVYAAARALFGSAQIGIRLIEAAGLSAMAVGMVHLTRTEWGDGRIGLVAAALALVVHAQLDFWHTAQPESFGGMLTILGLVLALRAHRAASSRRAWLLWVLVGLTFGLAGCMKPPLAGQGAVVALLSTASKRSAERWVPIAGTALGGVAAVSAFVLWFGARGALDDAYRVLLVYTPHYTAIGWEGQSASELSWLGVREWFLRYSLVLPVGLVVLAVFRPTASERRGVVVLVALCLLQIAGVVMQAKFFPYHYGAIWPLTALLAALGWWKLFTWARRRAESGWMAALVMAAFMALSALRSATSQVPGTFVSRSELRIGIAVGDPDPSLVDALATVADVDAGHNRRVAAFIAESTEPNDHILVWGFEPVIYDMADRSPSTRYLYNVPQRTAWSRSQAQGEMMADLAAYPPAAIVVEHGDVFPWVTSSYDDSAQSLAQFPELSRLLRSDYALAAVIADFDVYLPLAP
jgi:hypothetical protein